MTVVRKNKLKKKPKEKFDYQTIGLALNVGFIIALPPIICTFIGLFIDKLLGSKPLFTIGLIILGTIGGTYSGIKEANKILKQK